MSEAVLLAAAAGLAAAGNLVGGLAVVARRGWSARALERFLAFSAGFLLSAAVIEILPESLGERPGNAVWAVAGFLMLHLVERLMTHRHVHHHGEVGAGCCPDRGNPVRIWGYLALFGMAVHTFFDGVSIAAGFTRDLRTALLVCAAVLLHKLPDGLVAASLVLAAGGGRARALTAAGVLGLATLAGSAVTWMVATAGGAADASAILAFSAGLFVYVAASDLVPEVNRSRDLLLSGFLVLGIVVFLAAAAFLDAFIEG